MVDLSDHKAPGKWKMHPTKSDRGNANTAIGHYVSSDLASEDLGKDSSQESILCIIIANVPQSERKWYDKVQHL